MKILAVLHKSLLEQARDLRGMAVSFLLPVMFMVIFGAVFGASFYTYDILVLNDDVAVEQEGTSFGLGDSLSAALEASAYEDGTRIFRVARIQSRDEVGDKLARHDKVALIHVPATFTQSVLLAGGAEAVRSVVSVEGDPGFPSFNLVRWLVEAVVAEVVADDPPVRLETVAAVSGAASSEFDYMAPGLMLLAIFMLLIQSATVLLNEVESGTLKRLSISRLRAWELLAGVSLSQVIFAALMIPLMFLSAIVMGFHNSGSLLDATVVGVVTSLSAIALGLITAGFSRTANEAFLLGNIVIVPIVFLSGVFFPVPNLAWITIAGVGVGPFELLPGTYAVRALSSVLLFGEGLGYVLPDLLATLAVSLAYFAIGVWLFRRRHMRAER